MIKKLFLVLFILASPLLQAAEKHKVIAFAQDTMANDFRKAQVFEVRDALRKYPEFRFVYSDGKGQTSLMIRQIEGFIRQKIDLLILGTNDEKNIVPVITKAYQAGIPVIVLDRGILGDQYTTFINSDNREIGRIAARYLLKKLNGKGRVLIFEGIPKADVTKLRTQGFLDIAKKYRNIKVIRRVGNYLRRDAIKEMEKLIKQGIHLDAIYAESDSMLSGVRLVLSRNNLDPAPILMVGVDYISEAQQAIRRGRQLASVRFPLGGKKSVETALKILKGKPVPRHIYNPVKLVTQKNVNKIKPIF